MTSLDPISAPTEPCTGSARVARVLDDVTGARRLWLTPGFELRWRAGQVVQLGRRGEAPESYFAVASSPIEGPELLLLAKDAGGVSATLRQAPVGAEMALHGPLGAGYAIARAAGRDVLLIGVGTAIAPLRALLVELIASRGAVGRLVLVHGVRRPSELHFADEHPAWRAAGVEILPVVSRPAPGDGWLGARGWVQAHVAGLVTPRTEAFIAGMPEMEQATRARLVSLGVPPDRIHVNYGG